jgi:hypothetical protein
MEQSITLDFMMNPKLTKSRYHPILNSEGNHPMIEQNPGYLVFEER